MIITNITYFYANVYCKYVHCTAVVSGHPNTYTSIFLRHCILYSVERWWGVTQIYKHIFTPMYIVHCTSVVSGYPNIQAYFYANVYCTLYRSGEWCDPNIQAYFYANVYCTLYSGGEWWPKYTSIFLRQCIFYSVQRLLVVTQIYNILCANVYCTIYSGGEWWPKYTNIFLRQCTLYCTLHIGGEWWPKYTSIFLHQCILYTAHRWWVVTQIYKHIFTPMYIVHCTAVVSGDPNIQAYFYANV